ncbi:MAG: hypothetical protein A4E65_02653 [Syntrophorhabdus sp. PtaU1.Bin153]|nr:MAG: hypothetical protein A4E65_02653 [Syntrophorhabdus sp. PtaU1.Bin153]
MAGYHDLSLFFEISNTIFSQIVERNNLLDPSIRRSVRRDVGVPFLTLKWQGEDGVTKNIHVSVVDEPQKAIAEVEINAWKDIERRKKTGKKPRKFRLMLSEGIETLGGIEHYDRVKAFQELSAALWHAYTVASRLALKDLQNEFERQDDEADPGPIKVEGWLGE